MKGNVPESDVRFSVLLTAMPKSTSFKYLVRCDGSGMWCVCLQGLLCWQSKNPSFGSCVGDPLCRRLERGSPRDGAPRSIGTSIFGIPKSDWATAGHVRPTPTKARRVRHEQEAPWSELNENWPTLHNLVKGTENRGPPRRPNEGGSSPRSSIKSPRQGGRRQGCQTTGRQQGTSLGNPLWTTLLTTPFANERNLRPAGTRNVCGLHCSIGARPSGHEARNRLCPKKNE